MLLCVLGLTMPVIVSLVSVLSMVMVMILAFCGWRCWRAKRVKQPVPPMMPPTVMPYLPLGHHLKLRISQSTPDLVEDGTMVPQSADVITEEKIGRSHFKTVIKQTTMPAVSQRHQSFQRQLSHKLDLSGVEFTIHSVKYKEQPGLANIRPELYRQNAQSQDGGSISSTAPGSVDEEMIKTCGKLYFSLKYIHNQESLIVTVVKAEGLPAKDFSGTSDPYVKIYLLPDRKRKCHTKVHRKTMSPEFDEFFVFPIPYSELIKRTLQFSIYDFDRFSRHDLIGIVLLPHPGKDTDLDWVQYHAMDILCVKQVKRTLIWKIILQYFFPAVWTLDM